MEGQIPRLTVGAGYFCLVWQHKTPSRCEKRSGRRLEGQPRVVSSATQWAGCSMLRSSRNRSSPFSTILLLTCLQGYLVYKKPHFKKTHRLDTCVFSVQDKGTDRILHPFSCVYQVSVSSSPNVRLHSIHITEGVCRGPGYRVTSLIRTPPPQDPTVGPCLGAYAGPRGGRVFL